MTITLRKATIDDGEILLLWRNDPSTYRYYHTPEPVERDAHFDWFRKSLESPTRTIYIAEENGVSVGMIRVDRNEAKQGELSWAVAMDARGRGVGSTLLSEIRVREQGELLAEIMTENLNSIRMVEAAGFIRVKTEGGVALFKSTE